MNNYVENDTFEFGNETSNENGTFNYNDISGLGESNYENEDLFNTEVSRENNESDTLAVFEPQVIEEPKEELGYNVEVPIEYQNDNLYSAENNRFEEQINNIVMADNIPFKNNEQPVEVFNNEEVSEEPTFEDAPAFVEEQNDITNDIPFESNEQPVEVFNNEEVSEEPTFEEDIDANVNEIPSSSNQNVDNEFLDGDFNFENYSIDNGEDLPVVEPTVAPSMSQSVFSETPIEELNKLTEFTEDKIQTTDIKSLFDRVGINVKEASDIFKKNTEMKEKIDTRFEELKKLQSEVEKTKQAQYDEINAYKEEVLSKLTEKKQEIEKRLNKLKEFQTSLEKEKEEFEQYRKQEKEEIERVQKEIQEAYDGRREELNHIEDVLRKQKDALDEERSQLSLDRIQYESDKNELANNLLKFNEIVDTFTNGMDKINKE